MRSYINQLGDSITVSEEHLKISVKIKRQLQDASPSRKCNWRLHKQCMEVEGFFDSDTNENYRQMIKQYQQSIGELPKVKKYADMVADSKLESIKELVGNIAYEKRENQHVLRQLNQVKREVIDHALIAEQIGNAFKEYDFSDFDFEITPRKSKDGKQMIVILTDMHIGALVDTDVNKYDFEIAKQRLTKYLERIIAKARYNGLSDIHIVNLGDVVEHSNMRYGQAYHTEFTYSEQLAKSSDLIIKFIKALANEGFKLTYAGIAGNHDRVNDKDKNIDGDHAQKSINNTIKIFIDNAKGMENVTFIPTKDYSHRILDLNGKNFKFVHGDLDSYKDENLVAKHSAMDGIEYDAVIMGHYHHFRIIEVGMGKQIIMFGSLKGSDEYSEKLRRLSNASQGLIIIDGHGEYEPKRINLQ